MHDQESSRESARRRMWEHWCQHHLGSFTHFVLHSPVVQIQPTVVRNGDRMVWQDYMHADQEQHRAGTVDTWLLAIALQKAGVSASLMLFWHAFVCCALHCKARTSTYKLFAVERSVHCRRC